MATSPNKLTPEQQKSQQMSFVNMLWNLFRPNKPPLFNVAGVPRDILEEFVHRRDVLNAASQFLDSLMQIWREQYPKISLLESEIHPHEISISEPQLTPIHRAGVNNMIWGLFMPINLPFFNRSGVPSGVLDDFIQRKDVLAAAYHFVFLLFQVWTKQYPAVSLLTSKISAMDEAEPKVAAQQPTQEPLDTIPCAPTSSDTINSKQNTIQPVSVPTNQGDPYEKPAYPEPVSLPPPSPTRITTCKSTNPIATFQVVPNAKSGQAYTGKIAEAGAAPRPIQFRNVRFRTDLGLSFNESGELLGTPVVAGDHEITFQWSEDSGKSWSSGECVLIVNPDPRSLWKIDEPPVDSPYKKDHIDKKLIPAAGFSIAAASRRGRSHEHSGTFRDDDFFVHHDTGLGWSVLIVADGAGSAKSSRWGSKLAVKAAGEHLVSNLAGETGSNMNTALNGWDADPAVNQKTMNDAFYLLFQKAAFLAIEAIEAEAKSKNAPVKEYSTTLLAAAVKRQGTETFVATFWMGDGAIAAYGPRAKVRLMGVPDGGEFAGQTRFLDRAALMDKDFFKRVSIGRFPGLLSVMLMTDGISDPRFETDNGLKDKTKWDALWDEIAPCLASPKPDERLVDWLHFFTPGHHDDRTIALLWYK